MDYMKIGALIIGGLIVLSYFVDFKSLLSKLKKEEDINMDKDKDIVIKMEDSKPLTQSTTATLSDIVAKWESLKAHCENRGLVEASAKLEEVFPLLIKKS